MNIPERNVKKMPWVRYFIKLFNELRSLEL